MLIKIGIILSILLLAFACIIIFCRTTDKETKKNYLCFSKDTCNTCEDGKLKLEEQENIPELIFKRCTHCGKELYTSINENDMRAYEVRAISWFDVK